MSKIIKFLHISNSKKKILLEAFFYSGIYRYKILHTPFKKIAPSIGTFRYETESKEMDTTFLKDVKWAFDILPYHVFWDSQCLDRALAAKRILNKRKLACTLYMGVQSNHNQMSAHAWLRCENYYVTGGNGNGYAITGIYGDKEKRL